MSNAANLANQERQLSESLARIAEHVVIAQTRLHDAKELHAHAKLSGDTKAIDRRESQVFDAQQQVDRLSAKAERIRCELDVVKAAIEAANKST